MTKHHIRYTALIAAGLFASVSLAQAKGFYFAGPMGLNVPALHTPQNFSQNEPVTDSSTDNPRNFAGNFAGALGFHLAPHWRMEGELSLRDDDLNSTNFNEDAAPSTETFKTWTGLVNVYHDFDTPGKIQPFVGAGAGYIAEETPTSGAQNNGSFAWQVTGGLKYSFDPSLSFSSAYRYLNDAGSSVALPDSNLGHELHMGVSYKLPVRPLHHPRGLNDTAQ